MNDFLTINADNAPTTTADFSIPEDIYNAICIGVADMGDIKQTFKGETKLVHKVQVAWVLDYKYADGSNSVVTQRYTASYNEKSNLVKMLTGWGVYKQGQNFTLASIPGQACRIVITEQSGYSNVTNVMKPNSTEFNIPNNTYAPAYWFDNKWQMVLAPTVVNSRRPKTTKIENSAATTTTQVSHVVNDNANTYSDELPF